MKICGIVGWKNSGKTFFAQKLIKFFVTQNFSVASIKHAHHNFDIDKPGTDSYLHRLAGSRQVIVSSSKRWAKISENHKSKEKSLNELLSDLNNPEIVIVEGFKNDDHPKIEIINTDSDDSKFLYPNLKNVIAVVSNKTVQTSIKQFNMDEIEKIGNFILETV